MIYHILSSYWKYALNKNDHFNLEILYASIKTLRMGYILRCVFLFFNDMLLGKDSKIFWVTNVGDIYYLTSEVIANC